MKKLVIIWMISGSVTGFAQADERSYALRMAETVMNTWTDSFSLEGRPARWSYDMGVVLKGFEGLWLNTGDVRYFNYITRMMDFFVREDGGIKTYKPDEYNIDHINNGKLLLTLYRVTGKKKYKLAADLLREQLRTHPRTQEGGFWHKKIYPYQMWLDGLYMAEPFYAEYSMLMHDDQAFDDIANQFIWMENHARDPHTGLLYHGWDESKQMKWADPATGLSGNFWARAMGWYASALVDVLDYFPPDHPRRKNLVAILNRLVEALEKQQDEKTGLWLDVMNYEGPGREKNYFEASASCQFTYAVAKGVRMEYLPPAKISIAKNAFNGIISHFIKAENGQMNLYGTVKVSGLGGKPFRDGSFDYYMSEPVVMNDPKGIGAFLLAADEMEMLDSRSAGRGKNIVLDRYFNSEKKKDAGGGNSYWHYVWEERSNSGFSFWGHVFQKYGAMLSSLDKAPRAGNLQHASVYIIVDPDHVKDNPDPNLVSKEDILSISDWVRAGGTLVLMANDSANCELENFNRLAAVFGLRFTNNSLNMVKNDIFSQGEVRPGENNPVFKKNWNMYLKELSALEFRPPAQMLVTKGEDVIMAVSRLGKGFVFAVGDPWLYNEYVDGRKLPPEYENYRAAEDLVKWLLNPSLTKLF